MADFYPKPYADGSVLDFTPSTGTDHYPLVIDGSDGTYNEGAAIGNADLYLWPRMPAGAYTIDTVALTGRFNTTAGSGIKGYAKLSGVTASSATETNGTGAFSAFETAVIPHPGGGAWTVDDFNASEFGHIISSLEGGEVVQVSDLGLAVYYHPHDMWTEDADTRLVSATRQPQGVVQFKLVIGISSDNITWLETANGQVSYGPVLLEGMVNPLYLSLSRQSLVNVYRG